MRTLIELQAERHGPRLKRKKQEEPESPLDSDSGDKEGAGFELHHNEHSSTVTGKRNFVW